MHFQIFIPRKQGAMDLSSVGLGDLVINAESGDLPAGPNVIGTDGNPLALGPGKLWSWLGCANFLGDNADWIPAVKSVAADGRELAEARYWLGVHKSSPPTPAELLRIPNPKYSLPLTDEEGRVWQIPVARRHPVVVRRNPDGSFSEEIHAKYRDYFDRAAPFWNAFVNKGSVDFEVWWDFCQYALSQNYRIPQELMSQMGILTDEVMREIPRIALDIDEMEREFKLQEEAKQKKASGG